MIILTAIPSFNHKNGQLLLKFLILIKSKLFSDFSPLFRDSFSTLEKGLPRFETQLQHQQILYAHAHQ